MIGSVSEQVRALKNFLLGGAEEGTEAAAYFDKVAKGEIPLVITVNKVRFLERSMRLHLLLTRCFHRPQCVYPGRPHRCYHQRQAGDREGDWYGSEDCP